MLTSAEPRFDCPNRHELERDRDWWKIYRESFPANEQESPSIILEATERGTGIAFRAFHEERTAGIATTHLLLNPAAVFLVYLAVDPQYRGIGIGGPLLEYALSISRAKLRERGFSPIGMVWEVDPPGVVNHSVEAAVRERRIKFFRRHAAITLPEPYFQPPLHGGVPVPMQLMFRAAPDRAMPNPEETRALIAAMYFEKYGAANGISRDTLTALLARNTIPRNNE